MAHLLGNAPSGVNVPQAVSEAVTSTAAKVNDLTGMVKKKGKKQATAVANNNSSSAVSTEADVLKQTIDGALASAAGAVDSLLHVGGEKAAHAAESVKSAAKGVVQEIMSEGQELTRDVVQDLETDGTTAPSAGVQAIKNMVGEIIKEGQDMTRQNVEAVTETTHDIKAATDHAREHASHTAHEALDKAVQVGQAVVAEVVEEGKEATKGAVDALAGTAEDVMGGIEKMGGEGKRKIEEVHDAQQETAKKLKVD